MATNSNISSSSTSSVTSNTRSSSTPISITNQSSSVKLNRDNYLIWHATVLPIIKGHRLDGHILGTKQCPQEFLTSNDTVTRNVLYDEWQSSDQLLLGWLYTTMTDEMLAQLLDCSTSYDLWMAAKELSGAQNRARVMLYKSEFQRTRKGSLKMEDYLSKMKNISDSLLLAGNSISLNDLITQVLAGLDAEYNPIVCQLAGKENLSWVELQATLLTYESRLEQLNEFSNLNIGRPVANTATQTRFTPRHNDSRGFTHGNSRGGRASRGHGRMTRGNSRPICQVCGRNGHTALTGYYRFDHSYTGSNDPRQGIAPPYYSALVANSNTITDPSWYADSGVDIHVTHDQS